MALAHTPGNLGIVKPQIQQTECLYLDDGTWQFDVWTPSGQYRTRLAPDIGATEDEILAWGRSVWTDCRWLFWKVV